MVVAIAVTLAPAAFGQTYIVPDGDCGAITIHATRGTAFPNLGETIDAARVKEAYVYLPKQRVALKPAVGPRSLDFDANVLNDGVVMAAVSFTPTVSGNETQTEHAKAFIFCGTITPRADWQRSTGLGLEIYPQGWNGPRPRLKPGDPMRFIAVDKATNKLIRDLPMELYRAGAGRIAGGAPAQYGGMNFPYQEPGRYMVVTTYRRPDPQQPEHWLVDTSTLTFEIK
ncbi:MAG TPA: hypothetical protein VER58_02330 [Thermoanaerobaculia bacterium]|nr:hypothetical protein [Thermoanaerobaculia bacterium]